MVRKLLSGILIYYYFDNMRLNNNSGFTLIEVMIVIIIIGIMSVFFVVNIRPDNIALLRMDTTRLAADIRYVRSMAASRATYNGSYPSGGYGIVFTNGNGTTVKSTYQLYAGSTSNVLKTVTLSNVAFRLVDPNYYSGYEAAINANNIKRFVFKTENIFESAGFYSSASNEYQIDIYYGFLDESIPVYYKSTITIGQKTSDDFVWSNLLTTYDTNRPVCGNGVLELGEACEPVYENGDPIPNTNCRPDCAVNTCGDGYVMQSETCEIANGLDNDNYPECPNIGWLYSCSDINSYGDCGGVVDSPNCCPTYTRGYCLDCQWLDNISPLPCI